MTLVTRSPLENLKFYFHINGITFNIDRTFEEVLKKFHGKELDMKDKLRFAPVQLKGSCWVHAIEPTPNAFEWPLIAQHKPFKLEKIEGEYILEIIGFEMTKTGKIIQGSTTVYEEIFTKLMSPRFLRLKRVDRDEKKRIDIIYKY